MIYEYDDVVTAKDVLTGRVKKEDIIGKRGWLLDFIPIDMNMDEIEQEGLHSRLGEIDLDSASPFGDGDGCVPFTYFLPEKEESAAEPAISGTATGKIGKESYEVRQYNWLKANDIGEGDKVRIVRKAEGYKDGWDNTWLDSMDDEVGKVGTVVEDSGNKGIVVDTDGGHWSYPYFVLEKVEEESLFKDGDRVRIVKEWLGFKKNMFEPTVGKTGRIKFVSGSFAKVVLDSADEWTSGGEWAYGIDALELIEDAPEYVPFDLSDPKDRDFLRGKWVRSKNLDVFNEFEIAHFVRINNTNQDIKVETSNGISYFAGELLYDYEFLDGSHVGRRKEEA